MPVSKQRIERRLVLRSRHRKHKHRSVYELLDAYEKNRSSKTTFANFLSGIGSKVFGFNQQRIRRTTSK